MNKNYTLKELADIGAVAANLDYVLGKIAREAFTKAILDNIGYEFPKDEEREAFERWCELRKPLVNHVLAKEDQFAAWKAGREELRKTVPMLSFEKNITITSEPAWIPWDGGECPLPDTVKRWEYRNRDGFESIDPAPPKLYRWIHTGDCDDIVAYRLLEG